MELKTGKKVENCQKNMEGTKTPSKCPFFGPNRCRRASLLTETYIRYIPFR